MVLYLNAFTMQIISCNKFWFFVKTKIFDDEKPDLRYYRHLVMHEVKSVNYHSYLLDFTVMLLKSNSLLIVVNKVEDSVL